MAPDIAHISQSNPAANIEQIKAKNASAKAGESVNVRPLQLTGALDHFEHLETTPVIGREYPTIQLRDLLYSDNADELLRELAIVISRRGVVFFRGQDITPDEQKQLTDKLGHLAGKPSSSGLHIHPIVNAERQGEHQALDDKGTVNKDNTISVISSKFRNSVYYEYRKAGADEWHSDITFEPVPADYTSLKVHTLPPTGGDTLWSSGYEIYDLLSEPFKKFAESLTGYFAQPHFNEAAERNGFRVHPGPRGNPLNVGEKLEAHHPFVRTNPVTGWKSIFGLGSHFQSIEGLTKVESNIVKQYILDLVTSSHGAQARFKWNKNDLAIWDNRSVYHAATPDYDGLGDRAGVRAVSLGEKPFYDPASKSRREELRDGQLI
jgi:alpha-ketoglutarate-dependent taurine dioxygenase